MNNETVEALSISEFVKFINEKLGHYPAKVIGEISEASFPESGHVYFTLKDKQTGDVLKCIIWNRSYQLYGIKAEVGMEVMVTGSTKIYGPRGTLSFHANSIELVGEGPLIKAYKDLQIKLSTEGLFSIERKKPLPDFPTRVGVISSKQGAVIHDFTNNLNKHGIEITFLNSKVEGPEALPDLYNAIRTLKTLALDIIVIMRGGGSMQSFAPFNSEKLVREIANSEIPIITAVGHHQDVPLCALVADVTVSTPTAAANLIGQSWDKGLSFVQTNQSKIIFKYSQLVSQSKLTLELKTGRIFGKFKDIISILSVAELRLPKYLTKISESFYAQKKMLVSCGNKISNQMKASISSCKIRITQVGKEKLSVTYAYILKTTTDELINLKRLVNSNDPNRQLSLGYSLLRNSAGKLVKTIKDVNIGESISLTIEDGLIASKISSIKSQKHG